ncbi:uncharacterized protein PAE49_005797 isoform 2-T2 [Odontesthes bonariensis]|uniref:uncharacterized protein LOC142380446 isoform X2 n=1 Tax=Odontesthes bonariensis TaxID=219752 RepID=UPI003F5869E7
MEEEINSDTLVLRKVASAPKEEKEDQAVISEVNPKELATPLSKVEAAARCHSRLLLVCLGILCVLLAAIIVVMAVYINMVMNKQDANLSAENQQLMVVLKNRNEQLTADNRVLKNQTEQLTADNTVQKNRTEQLTADNRVLKNQTEQLTADNRVLKNRTEQLTADNRVLKNRTEQLTADNRVLKNQTEQLTADNTVQKNRTEQLTADNRVLKNQTEQLTADNRVLKNQTEQLTADNRVLKNQTEQLTADNRVLKNQTEQLTADNRVLKNQTEQLTADNRVLQNRTDLMTVEIGNLENQTKHLNRQKDDLNWTLGVILTFNNFPVNQFCPDKKCQPCRGGWILYQKKCYLFYDEPAPWKSWTQSQTYCKDSGADLVVIDNQQEQEFISNNTKYYFSVNHGYWIGLKESNGTFIWIDGRRDTLRYWLETGGSGSYVLVIPDKSPTQSWKRSSPEFQLRFICESEALIRSN